MKSTIVASLAALAATFALVPTSHADGFGEVVVGIAAPLGDSDHTKAMDTSLKLGVRAGELGANGLGVEGAVDWTPESNNYSGAVLGQTLDVSIQRFRVQGGLRVGKRVGHNLLAFGRALAGVDIVHVATTVTVLGSSSTGTDTDTGLALEVGGGALVNAGPVVLGAQVAVPMGFHFGKKDSNGVQTSGYNAFDLDVLFTVATTF
jgi:hypothetical protein